MPRKRRTEKQLADLARKIDRIFKGSPLDIVGHRLSELVTGTMEANRTASAAPGQDVQVIQFVTSALERLPQSFGERFAFDAAIISSIAEDWSSDSAHLSRMLVPRYAKEWGHVTVTLPADRRLGHAVDMILIPGEDDLTSVDLLDYPWLCHELGHNLHFQNDAFARCFQQPLNKRGE